MYRGGWQLGSVRVSALPLEFLRVPSSLSPVLLPGNFAYSVHMCPQPALTFHSCTTHPERTETEFTYGLASVRIGFSTDWIQHPSVSSVDSSSGHWCKSTVCRDYTAACNCVRMRLYCRWDSYACDFELQLLVHTHTYTHVVMYVCMYVYGALAWSTSPLSLY